MKRYLLVLLVLGMSVAQTSIAVIEISHETLTASREDISNDYEISLAIEDLTAYAKQREYQHSAPVQYALGLRYAKGESVPKDYFKAKEWYQKAANQDYAPAQFALGLVYSRGEGVRQDYAKAKEFHQKAANQNYALAQYALGLMYVKDETVRQDYAKAKELFGKSCDNGLQEGCSFYRIINQRGR